MTDPNTLTLHYMKDNHCPFRPISCEWCHVTLEFKDVQGHVFPFSPKVCDRRPVDCPWGCGAQIEARDLPDARAHTPVCPNGRASCPWGCGAQFQKPFDEAAHRVKCPNAFNACKWACGRKFPNPSNGALQCHEDSHRQNPEPNLSSHL